MSQALILISFQVWTQLIPKVANLGLIVVPVGLEFSVAKGTARLCKKFEFL